MITRRMFIEVLGAGLATQLIGCGGGSGSEATSPPDAPPDTPDRDLGKPGKHTDIFRWGIPYGGNDWSFVRTPSNYDPAGSPHPLLILKHGNGWLMDGSEQLANFSSKTQFGVDQQNAGVYLDTQRADYVEYSSPLIESFLANGFVVCGCQNTSIPEVDDSGYGNEESRQLNRMFFEYLQGRYNIQSTCHLAGASAGAAVALSAAQELGKDTVNSVILLYPLISLRDSWLGRHKNPISAAFAIEDTNSESEFNEKADPFDPMNADPSSWPPVLCRWTAEDNVVPQHEHWLAFEGLLTSAGIDTQSEQVSGPHGSYQHFEGNDGYGISRLIDWALYRTNTY